MFNPYGPVPVTRFWHEWTQVPSLGVEVHARVWNSATAPLISIPLVLVAGLGVSSTYWVRLGRRLASSFHVLAPDLPGFGGTPRPPDSRWPAGPDVRQQSDQLLAWMDARRLDRVVLCGHSTGGQVAIDFAARHPDRVDRVILAAPTFMPGRRSIVSYLPRLLVSSLFEAPSLTAMLIVEYNRAGIPRAFQQASRFMRDPVERKLPNVKAPTLVIAGEYDLLVTRSWTDAVAARLPRSVLVSIDNVGHAFQHSAPTVTAKVIHDFLLSRLDADCPPAAGTIVAPVDDPRHDPHGPPQPISPTVHGLLDYAVAAVALIVPRVLRWPPRTRSLLTAAAMVSTANNLLTDHGVSVARKIPVISHANADVFSGLTLIIAAATRHRRAPRAARWATVAMGVYQIASAALTAKPTGPGRVRAS